MQTDILVVLHRSILWGLRDREDQDKKETVQTQGRYTKEKTIEKKRKKKKKKKENIIRLPARQVAYFTHRE